MDTDLDAPAVKVIVTKQFSMELGIHEISRSHD